MLGIRFKDLFAQHFCGIAIKSATFVQDVVGVTFHHQIYVGNTHGKTLRVNHGGHFDLSLSKIVTTSCLKFIVPSNDSVISLSALRCVKEPSISAKWFKTLKVPAIKASPSVPLAEGRPISSAIRAEDVKAAFTLCSSAGGNFTFMPTTIVVPNWSFRVSTETDCVSRLK